MLRDVDPAAVPLAQHRVKLQRQAREVVTPEILTVFLADHPLRVHPAVTGRCALDEPVAVHLLHGDGDDPRVHPDIVPCCGVVQVDRPRPSRNEIETLELLHADLLRQCIERSWHLQRRIAEADASVSLQLHCRRYDPPVPPVQVERRVDGLHQIPYGIFEKFPIVRQIVYVDDAGHIGLQHRPEEIADGGKIAPELLVATVRECPLHDPRLGAVVVRFQIQTVHVLIRIRHGSHAPKRLPY